MCDECEGAPNKIITEGMGLLHATSLHSVTFQL